ncbi:Acetyl-coenzyme A synthetase (plasmid) [Rhodococcus sp. WAY2]|nr:Acetyl-coenzyme A synthetase [Rhodococcus sp. WAY2]
MNTARSSTGALPPPCGRETKRGINGSTISHNASGTNRRDNSSTTSHIMHHKSLHPHETRSKYDEDGALWVLGRVDDVMNVSGHRISTSEVESALVGHHGVAEATSSAPPTRPPARASSRSSSSAKASRTPATPSSPNSRPKSRGKSAHREAAADHRRAELPKTRSGKIMRRLLKDIAEGREIGDTFTLVDPKVFDAIRGK